MGQAERDRQRAERREAERLCLEQKAREAADVPGLLAGEEEGPGVQLAAVEWGEFISE